MARLLELDQEAFERRVSAMTRDDDASCSPVTGVRTLIERRQDRSASPVPARRGPSWELLGVKAISMPARWPLAPGVVRAHDEDAR
jgi:hypothetical protein